MLKIKTGYLLLPKKMQLLKHYTNNQNINIQNNTLKLVVKREDLIHPFVSGNKYRKLKFNIKKAEETNSKLLLTFGGAFSNHIAAVAWAGKENRINTIGVIRGEELRYSKILNPTLQFAKDCGMHLKFISREDYRCKANNEYITDLRNEFNDFYLIPEGGTNGLAVKGCEEIFRSRGFGI